MRRQRIGEVLSDLSAPPPPTDEQFERMTREEKAAYALDRSERNIAEFAGLVVEWNFAGDDGEVLPITSDSVMLLDQQAFESIQNAYAEATRRVAPPLPRPSPAGELSEEALTLPQEPL